MMVFFKIWPEFFIKDIITLQIMRLKLKTLIKLKIHQKQKMQLHVFIELNMVANLLWYKSENGDEKELIHKQHFEI
jgi:hypothetical protein